MASSRDCNNDSSLLRRRRSRLTRLFAAVRPAQDGWLRSLLFSIVLHVTLLVALALIVMEVKEVPFGFSITASQTEEFSQFALLPDTLPQELPEVVAAEQADGIPEDALLKVDVPIPKLTSLPIPVEDASSSESTDAPQHPLSGTGEISAVAVSIQSRVTEAGGQMGEVQFALSWKDVNDLDIHVITPAGERISHLRRRSRDLGLLDVDMNVKGESKEPVENVRWIRNAPLGRYTVLVHMFRIHSRRNGRMSAFQLLSNLGAETAIDDGFVSTRDQLAVFRFAYVPQAITGTGPSR